MRDDPRVADRLDIAARIRASLAESFAVEVATLTPETSLYDDIGADSLAVMEFLCKLEDELEIELPESLEFAQNIKTVGDVFEAFQSRAA